MTKQFDKNLSIRTILVREYRYSCIGARVQPLKKIKNKNSKITWFNNYAKFNIYICLILFMQQKMKKKFSKRTLLTKPRTISNSSVCFLFLAIFVFFIFFFFATQVHTVWPLHASEIPLWYRNLLRNLLLFFFLSKNTSISAYLFRYLSHYSCLIGIL